MRTLTTLLLMTLGTAALATPATRLRPPTLYIWNASDSVPVGLYRLQPVGELSVTDLVAVEALEPLATFLADGGYLSARRTDAETCAGVAWANCLQECPHNHR